MSEKVEINIRTSVNTSTVNEDTQLLSDPNTECVANTGIERDGGIENIHEQVTSGYAGTPESSVVLDNGKVLYTYDENGADDIGVYLNDAGDNTLLGRVYRYGVKNRYIARGVADCVLFYNAGKSISYYGTVNAVTRKSGGNTIVTVTIKVYSLADNSLYQTRSFNATIVGSLVSMTGIAFVRGMVFSYNSTLEFAFSGNNAAWVITETGVVTLVGGIGSIIGGPYPGLAMLTWKFENGQYLFSLTNTSRASNGGYSYLGTIAGAASITFAGGVYAAYPVPYFYNDGGTYRSRVYLISSQQARSCTLGSPYPNAIGWVGYDAGAVFQNTIQALNVGNAPATYTQSVLTGFGYSEMKPLLGSAANGVHFQFPANALTSVYDTTAGVDGDPMWNLQLGLFSDYLYPAESCIQVRGIWNGNTYNTATQGTASIAIPANKVLNTYGVSDGGALGVPISEVGAMDVSEYVPCFVQSFPVSGYQDACFIYNSDNGFHIVYISDVITNRIKRVGSGIWDISSASPTSLYKEGDLNLSLGQTDYNNRAISWAAKVATQVLMTSIISYANGLYIDNGEKLMFDSMSGYGIAAHFATNPLARGSIVEYPVFIKENYIGSNVSNSPGQIVQIPNTESLIYVPSQNIPVPKGVIYSEGAANTESSTLFTQNGMPYYAIGSDVPKRYQAFSLFSQTYLFDGSVIRLANIVNGILQNDITQQASIVCTATGMQYIATSPTEAYFLSAFDNSIYTFDGGRALTKQKRMSQLANIVDGVFNVRDNTLLMETAAEFVWIRDGVVTINTKNTDQADVGLFSTNQGLYIMSDATRNVYRYTYKPLSGSTIIPLNYQTAYFGPGGNKEKYAQEYIFTLYSASKGTVEYMCECSGYDANGFYSDNQVFGVVHPVDWTPAGYARIRIQPKNLRLLASSVRFYSASKVLIVDLITRYEVGADAGVSASRSK